MPEICRFFGIVIAMYFNDHIPPHFHVHYTGRFARIALATAPANRAFGVTMLVAIVKAEVLAPYRLRLGFSDGSFGEVDIRAHVPFVGVFEPLRDPAEFARVRVDAELGTIVWPGGADLDPWVLKAWSEGREL